MSIRISALATAAALVAASVACEDNRTNNASNSPGASPAVPSNLAPTTSPVSPRGPESPVTNTNATVPANADVLANVANRDKLREPSDEAKILPAKPAKPIAGFTLPLRSSPWGESIGMLKTTGAVTEVARDPKGDYYLVLYPDPGDATKQLGGWLSKRALEDTSWASEESRLAAGGGGAPGGTTSTTLTCKKGEAHLKSDHDFCAKTCKDDGACGAARPEICDGLAFDVGAGNNPASVRYCVGAPSERGSRPSN